MSEAITALDDVEEESRREIECEPFVYRTEDTLTLHFDISVIQSEMRAAAPHELVLPYTQTMMGFLLFHPQPKNVFMIGLGGGSLPKYCYATLPKTSIVVAEINAQVIALRDTFMVPRDDERFRIVHTDGANFVRTASESCDVLLVDGFNIGGRSPQLCRQRFYEDCFRCLAPGGVIVVNLGGEHLSPRDIVQHMRGAFASSVLVVQSEDYANRIAFARKDGSLSLSREQFMRRLRELEEHHPASLRNTLYAIRAASAAVY